MKNKRVILVKEELIPYRGIKYNIKIKTNVIENIAINKRKIKINSLKLKQIIFFWYNFQYNKEKFIHPDILKDKAKPACWK